MAIGSYSIMVKMIQRRQTQWGDRAGRQGSGDD